MNPPATGRRSAALLLLAGALLGSGAPVQAKSLKDKLVGAWSLISFEANDTAGHKVPSIEGSDVKGRLFLTDSGLLSVQIIADYPKLASKDRLKTTPAENEAVAHGVLCFFGTYTVDAISKQIVFYIERSSFPNQATGKGFARRVTLTGDQLRLDSPGQAVGGKQTFVIVWKRMP